MKGSLSPMNLNSNVICVDGENIFLSEDLISVPLNCRFATKVVPLKERELLSRSGLKKLRKERRTEL